MLVSIIGWTATVSFACTFVLSIYAWSIAPYSRAKLWEQIRTRHFSHWIRLGGPDAVSEALRQPGFMIDELDGKLEVLKEIDDPELRDIIADLVRQNRFSKTTVLPIFVVTFLSVLTYILLSHYA